MPKIKSKKQGPLWRGPEEDGITFSLLSRFLVCRERFRLLVVKGLKTNEGFNHKLEYGNMWHVCEEAHAKGTGGSGAWQLTLKTYCQQLASQHPDQQKQVNHWYEVCKRQFPHYVEFWAKQRDVQNRSPLLQEQVFNVPYKLPSGRTVCLRGKWDSVDLIKGEGIWLQENKTKGDIRESLLVRQMKFDLQTMLYLVALYRTWENTKSGNTDDPVPDDWVTNDIMGVRYNVIRRPLAGGRGTIKQKKGESTLSFYNRLADYFKREPEYFFMRLKVEVTTEEVQIFRTQCLDPILEQLCDWWLWVIKCNESYAGDAFWTGNNRINAIHWRHPFGVRNVLDEGGSSDLDEYLATGSIAGLMKTDDLFPELRG
jgi:hypothetical protein